jgi:hypothetical protein
MTMIRKRYRVLILAALVAAVAVPLGFALSVESTPAVVVAPQADLGIVAASAKTSALMLPTPARSRSNPLPTLPDGAKLFFVGSALFGLAAVMRRTH